MSFFTTELLPTLSIIHVARLREAARLDRGHASIPRSSVADPDPKDPYRMFLGLLDPDPDPLVLSSSTNSKKELDSYSYVTSL